MNQVKPYALWLGHAGEGRDFRQIFDTGIRALIQVAAEEPPPVPPRELICCHFPMLDGTGNSSDVLSLAITTSAFLIKMHVPTLICCSMGMSRAPAIAAAALSYAHREPVEDCLRKVTQAHGIDLLPGLWNEVVGVLHSLPA